MKIWYCIINGGDGSAYPAFFKRKEDAEAREQWEEVRYGEGWAEPSVGCLKVSGDVNFEQSHLSEDENYNLIYPEE